MLSVMLIAIIFGAWKGLAWQVASLSAIFASYFVAYQLREPVSRYINVAEPWDKILAMLGVYLFTSLVIWIIFGYVRKIIDRVKLQDFDRHAGAVLGAIKGVILCMIITLFAVALLSEEQKSQVCCSYSGYFMAKVIDKIEVAMPKEAHSVLHKYLEQLDSELSSHGHHGHQHGSSDDGQPLFDAERTARQWLEAAADQVQTNR